ncbi:Isoamyl acetate-hydrolyzing esterase [Hyphodiscus hymeniophilus]|uniref:Isoamyl acetate-hydrolyzing esterase n=1 Tax=Hyphodiscus hymeniophilus TaxID=353542 RepID=A0A9P6VEH5_9HELO|nr:Isoamyl acetate-hydrolyzing esterase [Hyphodiscus hymeniophilus]
MSSSSEIAKVTVDKILLFGDSITEMSYDQEFGFNLAPALQHEYFRKLQVVARGYGGYTTEHGRYIIGPTLDAEESGGSVIRLMVIFFGTNDASVDAVTLERFMVNLTFIANMAIERKIPLIIVGPGLINEYVDVPGKSTMRNLEYSNAASKVAMKLGVPFIDLWHAFLDYTGWEAGNPIPGRKGDKRTDALNDLLSDGVHFTGKAYKIWYDMLLRTTRDRFPQLRSERLPTILPHIFDVDNSNLPASLWKDVKVEKLEMGPETK